MTPSLFRGTGAVDERSLMMTPDAGDKIQRHRTSFMTEEDWSWLKANSVGYVRLPVGYWVLNDDKPFLNARRELDWAFEMAQKYDIKILLDFHGLKGSQNGKVHSGDTQRMDWLAYYEENLSILTELAGRYCDSPALWGLEIINEPHVFGHYFALLRFYREAYDRLCSILRPGTIVVFQDGFLPPFFSGALRVRSDYPVIMDTHLYLIFPKLLANLKPAAYDRIRGWLYRLLIRLVSLPQPVMVGEWSSVLPQPMFNRRPIEEHREMLLQTIARQRRMFHRSVATFYWNYKTEGRGMYNFRSLVEDNGLTFNDK